MSKITNNLNIPDAADKSLEWLNKAIEYNPESVDALVNRAQFYLNTPVISGLSVKEKIELARKYLELADRLGTENPQLRFLAGSQWLSLGEFDKAIVEIQIIDNLSQETIEKYFLDIQDLKVVRFLLVSEILMRQGNLLEAISLTEESLNNLTEERHRIQILPAAIKIYALVGKISEARKYLDPEYKMFDKTHIL